MGLRGPANRRIAHFEAHVMEPSVGCKLWPFSKNGGGYGQMRLDGRLVMAHVVACERWHGPRPDDREVAHLCGNAGCWAGEHLRWATSSENNLDDKLLHGRDLRGIKHHQAKLTENDVRTIRERFAAGEHGADLAREYNVTHANICRIVARKTWAWLI